MKYKYISNKYNSIYVFYEKYIGIIFYFYLEYNFFIVYN